MQAGQRSSHESVLAYKILLFVVTNGLITELRYTKCHLLSLRTGVVAYVNCRLLSMCWLLEFCGCPLHLLSAVQLVWCASSLLSRARCRPQLLTKVEENFIAFGVCYFSLYLIAEHFIHLYVLFPSTVSAGH